MTPEQLILNLDAVVSPPDFDGADVTEADTPRLGKQLEDILDLMSDGEWRTVAEIADLTGHPENSISAQVRNARKARFGGRALPGRYRSRHLYEYKLET